MPGMEIGYRLSAWDTIRAYRLRWGIFRFYVNGLVGQEGRRGSAGSMSLRGQLQRISRYFCDLGEL